MSSSRASSGDASYVAPGEFARVRQEELRHLGIDPGEVDRERGRALRGLAISGGGIRSASFGLGVLQALVRARVLQSVDYLSTVSGGGYIGSSPTWFLTRRRKPGSDGEAGPDPDTGSGFEYGVTPEAFPLGRAERGDGGNRALDYIRQHGNYLTPGRGLDATSMLAVVLRASVVSIFIYGGMLVGVLGLMLAVGLFGGAEEPTSPEAALQPLPWTAAMSARIESELPWLEATGRSAKLVPLLERETGVGSLSKIVEVLGNPLLVTAAVLLVLFVLCSLAYAVIGSFVRGIPRYEARTWAQRGFGGLLGLTAGVTVLGLLPIVHDGLPELLAALGVETGGEGAKGGLVGTLSGVATALGGVLGVFQARAQQSESAKSGLLASLRLYAGVSLLLFGVLVGAFAIADALPLVGCLALGAFAFLVGATTNLNYLGLHRMYRDRLMEAFMPGRESVEDGEWRRAEEADALAIDRTCEPGNQRPYHLVNTNVVLVDSNVGRYRGRGGDSFVLSRLYCGSEATGWRASRGYMKREGSGLVGRVFGSKGESRGRGMTLPTAMAISGAAANPNSGVAGRGATRSLPVSILMSLLNLRLGYWAAGPREGRLWVPPNFIRPGIPALFGRKLSEDRGMLELTDGGHFENLGIYELVRRRVDQIIVCDGGCDPEFRFSDLSNAIERVRADFGVEISFDEEGCLGLGGLLPGSGGVLEVSGDEADTALPDTALPNGDKIEVAKRGHAVGRIRYPEVRSDGGAKLLPAKTGWLVLVKTTVVRGLPQDVYSYKLSSKDFPDETTGDQFFDENQLEAYRELGYQIGRELPRFSEEGFRPPQTLSLQSQREAMAR